MDEMNKKIDMMLSRLNFNGAQQSVLCIIWGEEHHAQECEAGNPCAQDSENVSYVGGNSRYDTKNSYNLAYHDNIYGRRFQHPNFSYGNIQIVLNYSPRFHHDEVTFKAYNSMNLPFDSESRNFISSVCPIDAGVNEKLCSKLDSTLRNSRDDVRKDVGIVQKDTQSMYEYGRFNKLDREVKSVPESSLEVPIMLKIDALLDEKMMKEERGHTKRERGRKRTGVSSLIFGKTSI